VTVPPKPPTSTPPSPRLSLSQAESAVGLEGGGIPGDPAVLQQIIDDFTYLRDVAWSVSQGLDAVVASASGGGFEGETADALRQVVSGEVKTFVYNIARAFSLAGEAVAEYRLTLMQAQQTVGGVVAQAESLAAGDAKLSELKGQVADQLAEVKDAEALMVRALQDASEMVSQPIKVPSLKERVWQRLKKALMIAGMVAAVLAMVVPGLGETALVLATAGFVTTAVDYAHHRASLAELLLSGVAMLLPVGKSLFSMGQLGAGLRGVLAGAGRLAGGAADVLRSPWKLMPMVASGLLRGGLGLGQGVRALPGLLWAGGRGAAALIKAVPRVIGEDFARAAARYPRLMAIAGEHFGYVVLNLGRFAGASFTTMAFDDMVALGFRGAWRAAMGRASWAGLAREFRAGWTAKGAQMELRTAHAAMDVWQMLHSWRPVLPEAKGAPRAGMRPGKMPDPMREWPVPGGGLREPKVLPVTSWTSRDLTHPTVVTPFTPSESGLLLPLPPAGTGHGLDAVGTPAVPLQRQKLIQDGEDGYLTSRGGLLVPVESVLPQQTLESLGRFGSEGAERLLTGDFQAAVGPQGITVHLDGTTLVVPHQDTPAPAIEQQLITPVPAGGGVRQTLELLRPEPAAPREGEPYTVGIGPEHLDTTVPTVFRHATTPGGVQHVTLPPGRTGVLRQGVAEPLRGAPQLDGVTVRAVGAAGAEQRLELIDADGVRLTGRAVPGARFEAAAAVVETSRVERPEAIPAHPSSGQRGLDTAGEICPVGEAGSGHQGSASQLLGHLVPRQNPLHGVLADSLAHFEDVGGEVPPVERQVVEPGAQGAGAQGGGIRLDVHTLSAAAPQERAVAYHKLLAGADDAVREAIRTVTSPHWAGEINGFTVELLPGSSVVVAVHGATGLRTEFDVVMGRGLEWTSREFLLGDLGDLGDGPREMGTVKVAVSREWADGAKAEAKLSYRLVGEPGSAAVRFDIRTLDATEGLPERFAAVDTLYGHRYLFDENAVLTASEMRLGGGLDRMVRFDAVRPEQPRVLRADGQPSQRWSASLTDNGRVRLVRSDRAGHLEFDGRSGRLLMERAAIRSRGESSGYVEIDHFGRRPTVVRHLDEHGRPVVSAQPHHHPWVQLDEHGGLKVPGASGEDQLSYERVLPEPEPVQPQAGGVVLVQPHDVVGVEQRIGAARQAARAAGEDPSTLLWRIRAWRTAAYRTLLQDARQAVGEFAGAPGEAREVGGFRVAVLDGGGREAVHVETGLRTVFDAHGRWVSREVRLPDADVPGMDQLTVVVTRSRSLLGWRTRYALAGEQTLAARFRIEAGAGLWATHRHAFMVTNMFTGHRYVFDADGTLTLRDVWVGDEGQNQGLGYLRVDLAKPEGTVPSLVDRLGVPRLHVRVEPHGEGQVRLVPGLAPAVRRVAHRGARVGAGVLGVLVDIVNIVLLYPLPPRLPGLLMNGLVSPVSSRARLEELVVDVRDGRLLRETVGARDQRTRRFTRHYYRIDYENGSVEHLNASGGVDRAWPRISSSVRSHTRDFYPEGSDQPIFRRAALGTGSRSEVAGGAPWWLRQRGTISHFPFFNHTVRVPLPGGIRSAWISMGDHGLRLVDRDGRVVDVPAEFAWEADGFTVRIPVDSAPEGGLAEYRFTMAGHLARGEWPVAGVAGIGSWGAYGPLRVIATRTRFGGYDFELGGSPEALRRFTLERNVTERARRFLFVIRERGTGNRVYFTEMGPRWNLPLEQVPLPGRIRPGWISMGDHGLRLVDRDGRVVDVPAEFAWEADGFTVRIPVDSAPEGGLAEYRFTMAGHLARGEWPVAGVAGIGSWGAYGPLRVIATRTRFGGYDFELGGSPEALRRFTLERNVTERARRFLFVIRERGTGNGVYFTEMGPRQPDGWNLLLEGTGLRVVGFPPQVVDAGGNAVPGWRAGSVGDGRVVVMPDLTGPQEAATPVRPVRMVHPNTLRMDTAEDVVTDADGVTARFQVPGAPEGVRAERRFTAQGRPRLLREVIALARGREERSLASLQVVVDRDRGLRHQLQGRRVELFRVEGIDERDATLADQARGGFTVVEKPRYRWDWESVLRRYDGSSELPRGIRRHYAPSGELLYRDLPLGRQTWLRAGVGGREHVLRVIGPRGAAVPGWRATRLDSGRIVAVPMVWDHLPEAERPGTRIVLDPARGVVSEILGVHAGGAERPGWYWKLDYRTGVAVPVRLDGTELDRHGARLAGVRGGRVRVVRPDGEVLLDRAGWDVIAGRPASRIVSEVPLPGRELSGLALRTVETGSGPEAIRRLEVAGLRAADWSAGFTVAERSGGGGYVITDGSGNRHWYLRADRAIEFEEVRLVGADRFLRFDAEGHSWVVEANGDIVPQGEYEVEPVVDPETGERTGWTVRLLGRHEFRHGAITLIPPEPGETVVWRFDARRMPVRTETRQTSAEVLITDVPLPGRQLAGLRLRVFRSEGPQAVRRIELVDLRAPDGRTRWAAAEWNAGGFVVVDGRGDHYWFLTPEREIEREEVRLRGTERFVRFGAYGRVTVVEAGGREVTDEYVLEPVIDPRTGQEAGLTVQLAGQAGPGQTAAWHFDAERMPVRTEAYRAPRTPAVKQLPVKQRPVKQRPVGQRIWERGGPSAAAPEPERLEGIAEEPEDDLEFHGAQAHRGSGDADDSAGPLKEHMARMKRMDHRGSVPETHLVVPGEVHRVRAGMAEPGQEPGETVVWHYDGERRLSGVEPSVASVTGGVPVRQMRAELDELEEPERRELIARASGIVRLPLVLGTDEASNALRTEQRELLTRVEYALHVGGESGQAEAVALARASGKLRPQLTPASSRDLEALRFQREAERFERRLGAYLNTAPGGAGAGAAVRESGVEAHRPRG
jgi:hypothetical protein